MHERGGVPQLEKYRLGKVRFGLVRLDYIPRDRYGNPCDAKRTTTRTGTVHRVVLLE